MTFQKMPFAKTCGRLILSLTVVITVSAVSSSCSAQLLQKPLRWLGEGYGPGYHRCNPGPNSDYYNPYSSHNSMLISRLPQFQNQHFQSNDFAALASRRMHQGIPFSVYAAPRNAYGQNYGGGYATPQMGDQVIGGSFEPYDPTAEDQKDSEAAQEYDKEEERAKDAEAERAREREREEEFEKFMEEDDEPIDTEASDESVFKYNPSKNRQLGDSPSSSQPAGYSKAAGTEANLFDPFGKN